MQLSKNYLMIDLSLFIVRLPTRPPSICLQGHRQDIIIDYYSLSKLVVL